MRVRLLESRPAASARIAGRGARRRVAAPDLPTASAPLCETDEMADHADTGADAEVDVAVVGAGPAGAVAACTAARRGLSVALIDRETFPRDKICGDGLGPGAVRVLRDLDLDSVLGGRRRIESVTVFGPAGERSENPVPVLAGKSTDVFVVP